MIISNDRTQQQPLRSSLLVWHRHIKDSVLLTPEKYRAGVHIIIPYAKQTNN